MAQNKKTPCQRCGVGAYGKHCKPCDQTLMPIQVRMAKAKPNTASAWGEQPHVAYGYTKTMAAECAPAYSWWAGCDRLEFSIRFCEEMDRQAKGSGINYMPKEQAWL